jgi:hypothetical protein
MLITYCIQAQSTRIYLDQYFNPVTDSAKAAFKVILSKSLKDTSVWSTSRYNIKNQLIVEEDYKDRKMTMPSGKYKYYYNLDTVHYLKTTGSYIDGAKFGAWIEYYPDGKKKILTTYIDDLLNGPYEAYNRYDPQPVLKGQYVKGKKNGEWIYPAIKEIYKDDIKVSSEERKEFEEKLAAGRNKQRKDKNFKDARESYEFLDYMHSRLNFYFVALPKSNGIRSLEISFTVNKDGKLSFDKIIGDPDNTDHKKIAKMINLAPPWTPAESNGKPVSQQVIYRFVEDKREITKAEF